MPSPSAPLATTSSAAPDATSLSLGATAGWQQKADRTFRVIACLAPLVAAGITYTQIDPNGPNGEFNRITYSVLAVIAAGAIGILLAVKGIRFDEESFKLRRKGLYFMGFGLVVGAAGAGCAYLAWGGKRVGRNSMYAFVCFSISVFALAFGLLQVITGHDIRSATKFREQ
jgi:hypothetical protein